MTKAFLDKSICHLMDTKRPYYETVVVRMAPKFTELKQMWKQNDVYCAVQLLWYLWMKSPLFIHPEQLEKQNHSSELLLLVCTSIQGRISTAFLELVWACSQVQTYLSSYFLPIREWSEACSYSPAGWWVQISPSSETQENTSSPKEHSWTYTLAARAVCRSVMYLIRSSQWKSLAYHLVCHLSCKNII